MGGSNPPTSLFGKGVFVGFVLELRGVCKSYGGFRVLRGIVFGVGQGEFVVIRGRSGVGKTTLLNIMGLLDWPDEGRVFFEGVDVTGLDEDD